MINTHGWKSFSSRLEVFRCSSEASKKKKRSKSKKKKKRKKKERKGEEEVAKDSERESTFGINVVSQFARDSSLFTCVHARICFSSSPFPHTHDSSVRSLNSQASLFLFSSFPDPLPSRHLVFPLFSPALAVHSASLRVESVRVSSRVEYRVSSSSLCAAERGTHRASRGSDPSNRLYISNRIVYSFFFFGNF